mgnify:CR=1 FL=1
MKISKENWKLQTRELNPSWDYEALRRFQKKIESAECCGVRYEMYVRLGRFQKKIESLSAFWELWINMLKWKISKENWKPVNITAWLWIIIRYVRRFQKKIERVNNSDITLFNILGYWRFQKKIESNSGIKRMAGVLPVAFEDFKRKLKEYTLQSTGSRLQALGLWRFQKKIERLIRMADSLWLILLQEDFKRKLKVIAAFSGCDSLDTVKYEDFKRKLKDHHSTAKHSTGLGRVEDFKRKLKVLDAFPLHISVNLTGRFQKKIER